MNSKIIFFTKYPQSGQVKLRLSKTVGAEKAAEIYKILLLDNWQKVRQTDMPVGIEYSPPSSLTDFKILLGRECEYNLQRGKNMGWRMANAFARCWQQQFDAAILIGGDVPDLALELLQEAVEALKDNDVVLGPSADGGYYLIGFKKESFRFDYFSNINWSTNLVLEQTRKKISNHGNKLYLIEKRNDLDTFEDMKEFLESVDSHNKVAQEIYNILKRGDSNEDNTDSDNNLAGFDFICSNGNLR